MNSKINKSYVQQIRELRLNPISIGIISDRSYQNFLSIRQLFAKLNELPNYITILGAGNLEGADPYIRELTLDLQFNYVEYTPIHQDVTQYSVVQKYKQKYSRNLNYNFSKRYKELISASDKLIIFYNPKSNDKHMQSIIKYIYKNKIEKPYIIIN